MRKESGDENGSKDESDTKGEWEEDDQADWDRFWPGTREKDRERSIGHATLKTEPDDYIQAKNVNKTCNEGRGQDVREQGRGAGLGEMVLGLAAGLGAMEQDEGAGPIVMVEDEGAGLIVVVEDEGAGLIVMVEDEGAGLIAVREDEEHQDG